MESTGIGCHEYLANTYNFHIEIMPAVMAGRYGAQLMSVLRESDSFFSCLAHNRLLNKLVNN
jgi:hypothetical protein